MTGGLQIYKGFVHPSFTSKENLTFVPSKRT